MVADRDVFSTVKTIEVVLKPEIAHVKWVALVELPL